MILAIVLPLVLIKKGGGGDGHGPLPPGNMNPYFTAGASVASGSGASVFGRLRADKLNAVQAASSIPKQIIRELFLKDTPTNKSVGVDWRNLNFFGPNNMLISDL